MSREPSDTGSLVQSTIETVSCRRWTTLSGAGPKDDMGSLKVVLVGVARVGRDSKYHLLDRVRVYLTHLATENTEKFLAHRDLFGMRKLVVVTRYIPVPFEQHFTIG
jgi:hypothetical protein